MCGCGGECCGGTWCDDVLDGDAPVLTAVGAEFELPEYEQPGADEGGPGGGGANGDTGGDVGGGSEGGGENGGGGSPSPVTPPVLDWLTDWWPLVLAGGFLIWRSR